MSMTLLLILLVPTIEGVAEPFGCLFSRCLMKYSDDSILRGINRATFGSKLWLAVQILQLVTSSNAPDISRCFIDRPYQIYLHLIYLCALLIESQLNAPDSYISVLYS